MGACCVGLRCAVVPECACASAGGTFFGVGTTCIRGGSTSSLRKDKLHNDFKCCFPLNQGCSEPQPAVATVTITDVVDIASQGQRLDRPPTCVGNISSQHTVALFPAAQYSAGYLRMDHCGFYSAVRSVSIPCWQNRNFWTPSGTAYFIITAIFTVIYGAPAWRATVSSSDGTNESNGDWSAVTGHNGPPCNTLSANRDERYWSPATSCYSGTATLYRLLPGPSGQFVPYPPVCPQYWEEAGTITISAT